MRQASQQWGNERFGEQLAIDGNLKILDEFSEALYQLLNLDAIFIDFYHHHKSTVCDFGF